MADFFPIGPAYVALGDPTTSGGDDMFVLNEVEEVNLDIGVQNSFVTTATTAGAPVSTGVYTLPPQPTLQMQLNDADLDQLEQLILGGTAKTQQDAITGVDTTAGNFVVSGDQTSDYAAGDRVWVRGSTGNDGFYTVASGGPSYDGTADETTIPVDENVPDGTADGSISPDNAIALGGDITTLSLPTLAVIPSFQKSQGVAADNAIWLPAAFAEGLSNILFNRMQQNASANNAYQVTFRSARRKTDQDGTAIDSESQYGWMGAPAGLGLTWYLPSL